jgi:hypothetical protein
MVRTLHFRCEKVDALSVHSAWLWGARKTGQEQAYQKRREQEGADPLAQKLEKQVEATVTQVLAEPRADQAKWIRQTLDTCEVKAS